MDIAKAFEILSKGKIISSNSSEYTELAHMLLTESFFNELSELLNQIGYRLIGENGYFYIAKRGKLNAKEQQEFINRHQESILYIAFLRYIYPRVDRGSIISLTETIAEYSNLKSKDSTIQERLIQFSSVKNREDEFSMLEHLFKYLKERNLFEQVTEDNKDKYKVLDSINYYLSIVDSVETVDMGERVEMTEEASHA